MDLSNRRCAKRDGPFLREFAVLLTAIILAGRTASAFTAQIGAMVNREEVDAIRTLGLDPIDLLVIPRLLALLAMLPLLTFIAMLAGLLGGMFVGASNLGIPPQAYYGRMHDTMELRHFLVGLSKAPVFAVVIGLIGWAFFAIMDELEKRLVPWAPGNRR